jgi:hypothetical protein
MYRLNAAHNQTLTINQICKPCSGFSTVSLEYNVKGKCTRRVTEAVTECQMCNMTLFILVHHTSKLNYRIIIINPSSVIQLYILTAFTFMYLLTYLQSSALPEMLPIVQPFRKFPEILRNPKVH